VAMGAKKIEIVISGEDLRSIAGQRFSKTLLTSLVVRKLKASIPDFDLPNDALEYALFRIIRPGSARESVREAYIRDYAHRFRHYGIPIRRFWQVPRPAARLLTAQEAIEYIGRWRGVSVIAHPGKDGLDREAVRILAHMGMQGVEVYNSTHKPQEQAYFRAAAAEFGLLETSGSDFHGPHLPDRTLGRDYSRRPLVLGAQLEDFEALGATVYYADGGKESSCNEILGSGSARHCFYLTVAGGEANGSRAAGALLKPYVRKGAAYSRPKTEKDAHHKKKQWAVLLELECLYALKNCAVISTENIARSLLGSCVVATFI